MATINNRQFVLTESYIYIDEYAENETDELLF